MNEYKKSTASIAQSFVNVCHFAMTWDQLRAWANNELNPNDCLDANLVMESIIENHGIQLWDADGHFSDDAIRFVNHCFNASNALVKQLFNIELLKETA